MKDQWRKYTDRAKSGSGKAAIDEPEWFHIIVPIFSETLTTSNLATRADDLIYSESDGASNGHSEVEENDSEETNLASSVLVPRPRERKPLFDSSTSSGLDASSEQSHCSYEESEEVFDRLL